jgi:adenosylcobinamide kinase/adenosylcobinamide-phosphate guanylyltransferase
MELARASAQASGRPVVYVATATALDTEMQHRIERHRAERPADWTSVEAPSHLARSLARIDGSAIVIVDCLTLWLSNAMLAQFDDLHPDAALTTWEAERAALFEHVRARAGTLIMVSNEVGAGIVPDSALARRFRDEQGRLNQSLAGLCDHVALVVAGLALKLK